MYPEINNAMDQLAKFKKKKRTLLITPQFKSNFERFYYNKLFDYMLTSEKQNFLFSGK